MSRSRQVLIVEMGIFVILLAMAHHGAITAVLVGGWLGFALHSLSISRRPAQEPEPGAWRKRKG